VGGVTGPATVHPASVTDAGAFLARLLRLDPVALVRLRPVAEATVALWGRLPFGVLVTRRVRAAPGQDATVRAAELLDVLAAGAGPLPARHDADWRWPTPPEPGRVVERLPAAELVRVGEAAAQTLRAAVSGGVRGRAVGERVLRDALLDHVPIVVTTDEGLRVEVSQRLVQAVIEMGFLEPETTVGTGEVRVAAGWVGLTGAFGGAWHRPSTPLDVRPLC
jgi:hypothetical protein